MSPRDAVLCVLIALAAFGLGCWVGQRDAKKRRPLARPYHDPRDFMARWTNYTRVR